MIIPIFAISPINKIKTKVGWTNTIEREATFDITEKRFFQMTSCLGIDEKVFKQKLVQWSDWFVFRMWDSRNFRISKQDFMANCWLYPPKDNPEYKANKSIFKPKLMIAIEKVEELSKKNEELTDEQLCKMGAL